MKNLLTSFETTMETGPQEAEKTNPEEEEKSNSAESSQNSLEYSSGVHSRKPWEIRSIISELLDSANQLSNIHRAVSIFGGARVPLGHPWYSKTLELSKQLSLAGFAVISGGGPGLMEAANHGAFLGSSPSIGLNILLPQEQSNNPYQNVSLLFRHFSTRKVAFFSYSTAFVAAPGGFGTLDELAEILTLIQTNILPKVPIILFDAEFWAGLMFWIEKKLLANGLISEEDLDLIQILDTPNEVLQTIINFHATQSHQNQF